jgi:hypothetical protein
VQAAGFFRFFAGSPPGFPGQATSVVAAGLAAGEDPREAVRAALALHAYEIAFWDVLADGLADAHGRSLRVARASRCRVHREPPISAPMIPSAPACARG